MCVTVFTRLLSIKNLMKNCSWRGHNEDLILCFKILGLFNNKFSRSNPDIVVLYWYIAGRPGYVVIFCQSRDNFSEIFNI